MARPTRRSGSEPNPVGRILGYELSGLGSGSNSSKWRTRHDVSFSATSDEAFDLLFGDVSLDSLVTVSAGLTGVTALDPSGLDAQLAKDGIGRLELNGFLLRRLVTHAIRRRRSKDWQQGGPVTGRLLVDGLRMQMDLGSKQEQQLSESGPFDPTAMRLLQAQTHDPVGFQTYHRELALLQLTTELLRRRGIDLEAAYEDALGLNCSELNMLAVGAFAQILADPKAPAFDSATWAQGPRGNIFRIAPERVRRFFEATASSYEEFADRANSPAVNVEGLESYGLSPLIKWPFVRRTDGLLVAPVAIDLLERVTRTFAAESPAFVAARYGVDARGVLGDVVGGAYEADIRARLDAIRPGNVHKLPTDRTTGERRADLCLLEGGSATLIEIKSHHFGLYSDIRKDRESLLRALRPVAEALVQLDDTARAVRRGRLELPGLAGKPSRIVGLIVVRGEQIWLNSNFVRGIVEELFALERPSERPIIKYQIANDIGFDSLVDLGVSGASITDFLFEKCSQTGRNDEYKAEWDLHLAVVPTTVVYSREAGGRLPMLVCGRA